MNAANDSAFPNMNYDGVQMGGLTKREYFAAKALQGILSFHSIAGSHNRIGGPDFDEKNAAAMAVAYADALLAELAKEPAND